jgi:hypothetical protein
VILPLLDRLEEVSVWLAENGDELKKWIGRSDASTQGYLNERMGELVKSKHEIAMPVAIALGIKALPVEPKLDEGDS